MSRTKALSVSVALAFAASMTLNVGVAYAHEGHQRNYSPPDIFQSLNFDEIELKAAPYLKHGGDTKDSRSYIDLESARSSGESIENLTLFTLTNEMAKYAEPVPTSVAVPVWGNWCGPGHSGPGAPIDLLDRACKEHDQCYVWGENNCSCDKTLIRNIDRDYPRMSPNAQKVAKRIRSAFKLLTSGC